jgi:oxalate decarboxylase/phosphoglucose isomerase-like protein (cupin superfamily)
VNLGFRLDPSGELTRDGRPVHTRPRRLSELLAVSGSFPPYLADSVAAEAAVSAGNDPVLYRALRQASPPRTHGDFVVQADLIAYQPGELPGGEPIRSTGHWNLPAQLEVFQTISGRVAMLVVGPDYAYVQQCGPGQAMAVPFGVWHVSYVVSGPALVFNISANLAAAGDAGDKYERGEAPAVTLCRRAGRLLAVGPGPTPAGPPRVDWLSHWLPPGSSLAEQHRRAPVQAWLALAEAARAAERNHWPTRDGFEPSWS